MLAFLTFILHHLSIASNPPFCGAGWTPGFTTGYDVCIGVRGYKPFAHDVTNANYAELVSEFDVTRAFPCGSTSQSGIPHMDLWGNCGGSDNKEGVPQVEPLFVNANEFSNVTDLNKDFRCMEKSWGSSPRYPHHGVSCDNIDIGQDTVRDISGAAVVQNVIELHARGDLYQGTVKGVRCEGKVNIPCDGCGVKCQNWQAEASGTRTGAILSTSSVFGPGTFKVRAMVPKTTDTKTDGRGYVFAIWTFHYEEIHKDTKHHPLSNQYVEEPAEFQAGSDKDGWYSPWVHAIDIEIPANSPQYASTWKDNLGWNTMNMKNWIGDNNNHTADGDNFYQQLQVNAPEGKMFISEDGEYHDYEFQWYVDRSDYTKNYVQWSFDGDVIWKSHKFVPTRPGRFNIGPWPGWWSVDPHDPSPDFDTATVKIASIEVIPQEGHTPVSFPQTFDQNYGSANIECDFENFGRRQLLGRAAGHYLRLL